MASPRPELLTHTLEAVLDNVRVRLGDNLLGAAMLGLLLAPAVGVNRVLAWEAVIAIGLVGWTSVLGLQGRVSAPALRRVGILAAFVYGTAWGLAGAVLRPDGADLLGRAFVLLFFAMVSGGSALVHAGCPPMFWAESLPVWLVGLAGLHRGEVHDLGFWAFALAYVGLLGLYNRRQHLQIRGMIDLRLDNEALVARLREEHGAAEEAWGRVSRQHAELIAAYDRVHELAARDPLTGLCNRRSFLEALDEAVETAEAGRGRFCVALLDVDHFKHVNDRYGHSIGDRALIAIADAVQCAVRADDVVGRIGGEEIAVLFRGADLADALSAAERIRSRVTELHLDGLPELRLSVSMGVVPGLPGLPGSRLLARADEAMYSAKAEGRDRVIWSLAE